jgi:ATP-dependent DNA helicase RecG
MARRDQAVNRMNANKGVPLIENAGLDLEDLLRQFESPELEFKEKLPGNAAVAKTASAFANGRGGYFIVGVRDKDRAVVGIDPTEVFELEGRITTIVHDTVEPVISPQYSTLLFKGKTLFIVRIFPGSALPYYLKSEGPAHGTYMRIGSQTRKADSAYVRELELRRINLGFDQTVAHDAETAELSTDNIRRFIERRHTVRGAPLSEPTEKFLLQFEAIKLEGGRCCPTVGGLLMFSESSRKRFPYARIKCGRFRGTAAVEYIDQKDYDGPLDRQLEGAMAFYKANVQRGAKITGVRREERDAYPELAVREAIANAVCHRDYNIGGSDIKFAMFDDRIEISSPGALPPRISIGMLGKGISEARNKVIARIFREMGIIEEWGQGIAKMRSAMLEWGLSEPVFQEHGHFFKVILPGLKVFEPPGEAELDPDEGMILELTRARGRITTREAMQATGRSRPAVRRKLSRLQKLGLLSFKGSRPSDPTGYYIVIGEKNNF